MTPRSIIIGILLAFSIVAVDYFNTAVIRQIYLIGNQLPIGVFGVAVLLLLVWNPAVSRYGRRLVLRKTEVAIIAALALAACGWPSFMRTFTTVLAMPSHLLKSKVSWQTAEVMSYVPGASPLLADGYFRNWPGLISKIAAGQSEKTPAPLRRTWECLPPGTQALILSAAEKGAPDQTDRTAIREGLNSLLKRPDFYDAAAFSGLSLPGEASLLIEQKKTVALSGHDLQRLNRMVLDASFPDDITPLPKGRGVLLADGEPHPVAIDLLIQGSGKKLGVLDLPWAVWKPALFLWGGLGLFLALASGCMALIVHPQWSKRELLPYPIPRFLQELTQPAPGGRWPLVATSKLFWCGAGAMLFIHTMNDVNAWFPTFLKFPLQYDFTPLKQLFPDAAKVPGANAIFNPTIFPSVAAFAFFLSAEVSFSLGFMGFLYLAAGAMLIGNGISMNSQGLETGKFVLMVFGAYLASAAMVLYVGRHYYLRVAGSAVGMRLHAETPRYVTWAARGLVLCIALTVLLLRSAGLDPLMSLLLVALLLLIFFTVSRIYAETGALMVQTAWGPAAILLALFGVEAMGPTPYIILAIAGAIMVIDTRETWMAFFVNGLQIAETAGETPPRRVGPLMLAVVCAGLAVTLGATFLVQYNHGVNQVDRYTVEWVPGGSFDKMVAIITELSAHDRLAETVAGSGLRRLGAISPQPGALLWIGAGMVLVTACSFARLRFSWWPFHPVLFLVWGTWSGYTVAVSFMAGWLVKLSVTKLGGARSYHTLKPLMVGIIAGEVSAAILWGIMGAAYYFNTGLVPKSYPVFP